MTRRKALATALKILAIPLAFILMGAEYRQAPNALFSSESTPELSKRINDFSFAFMKQLASEQGENAAMSPQSIFNGLALCYPASGGITRTELAKALNYPDDNLALLDGLSKLREQLTKANGSQGMQTCIANAIWLDSSYAKFRKDYFDEIKTYFDASLFSVKFKDANKACDEINAWVSHETHNNIESVVSPGDFASRSAHGMTDEAAFVAINAVYFKGQWQSRFDKASTEARNFHPSSGRTVKTMMMHQRSRLNYAEDSSFKLLRLEYLGGSYSMLLLMPKEILEVKQMLALLNQKEIDQLASHVYECEVDTLLPKFKLRTRLNAKQTLSQLGVSDAFNKDMANFDSMIVKNMDASRIYLSEVYHDALIEVDEEGTEASAATTTIGFSIGCGGFEPSEPPAEFHADHPFLFLIINNECSSILFAGWIAKPEQL